jgi:hypothetical protein
MNTTNDNDDDNRNHDVGVEPDKFPFRMMVNGRIRIIKTRQELHHTVQRAMGKR